MRRMLRQHHNPGPDVDAAEQVLDVLIGQADAAAGDEFADRRRIIGAMNAILAGAEIHGARAQRIAGAARHEARQIGLARDHFRRRIPVRPFRLAADFLHAGPGKPLAADADAVANGSAMAEHVIEHGVAGIDDDGTRCLAGIERHNGAPQPLRQRAIYVIGRRGLGRRQADIIRRKTVWRGGRVAKRLRVRLARVEGRQQQQCRAKYQRAGRAQRKPAMACECLYHDLPHWDAHRADASDPTNATGAPQFRRGPNRSDAVKSRASHVSAIGTGADFGC